MSDKYPSLYHIFLASDTNELSESDRLFIKANENKLNQNFSMLFHMLRNNTNQQSILEMDIPIDIE